MQLLFFHWRGWQVFWDYSPELDRVCRPGTDAPAGLLDALGFLAALPAADLAAVLRPTDREFAL